MIKVIAQRAPHVWHRLTSPLHRALMRAQGVEIGERLSIVGRPIISLAPSSRIRLDDDVVLISSSYMTALGVARPVILRTLYQGAEIIIGSDTGMSGTTVCACVSVHIGQRCLVGADVLIADTDFHPVDAVPRRHLPIPPPEHSHAVVIGDDVFIGARTIVTKGVSIGNGAVIGAGSVVVDDIPANVVAAGVPARVVRQLGSKE